MSTTSIRRIGVVWANPSSGNLGVSALAWSVVALLEEVSREQASKLEIHFYGCTQTGPYELELPEQKIRVFRHGYYNYRGWKAIINALFGRIPGLKIMSQMDALFDMGEGDSFSDIYGVERFSTLCDTKLFASRFHIPQMLLPQTIGPFQSQECARRASKMLRRMDVLTCRDAQSHSVAASLLEKECTELVDVAFALPYRRHDGVGQGSRGIRVGLNVSGLLWNGGYTGKNELGLTGDYRETIIELAKKLVGMPEVMVFLVPHVFGGNCLPVEDDYRASVELSEVLACERVILAPEFSSPIEAKTFISSLDFFMGARMHACIAAISSGTPVVPMAYSRKFNGLFRDTLGYSRLVDLKVHSKEEVVEICIESLLARESIRREILDDVNAKVAKRLEHLKDILGNFMMGARSK